MTDHLDFIMEVEESGFDPENEDHIKNLEEMIESGLVWQLQGFWWRLAESWIERKALMKKHGAS